MAYIISDNITSPIADTTEDNLTAVAGGISSLRKYPIGSLGTEEAFTASLSDKKPEHDEGLSPFEHFAIESIKKAIAEAESKGTEIDISSRDTILILSTTKGNIEGLMSGGERISPSESATEIALRLGFTTCPIVVCNACVSGLAALILAQRLIDGREYKTAVVCGCDIPRKFIISGFQSLKAMSAEECRPFDMNRNGLNIGEAAATIILSSEKPNGNYVWQIERGAINNDAFHVSAPHRKGEGLLLAMKGAMRDTRPNDLLFVNAHGTATLFNDQMESVAIERAGLGEVPVNGLKGYFGHTMGAAGILETIISIHSADKGVILGTRGFDELGVSGKIEVSAEPWKLTDRQKTEEKKFLKILSGFGGCNAAAMFSTGDEHHSCENSHRQNRLETAQHIIITPDSIELNGDKISVDEGEGDILTRAYKQHIGGYSKFYKMDKLSRLGFVATELILSREAEECGSPRFTERSDRAIVFCNKTSSLHTDRQYAETISNPEDYYPSPSLFVYTLPNIVTGEIAMRNMYRGETSFYILPKKEETVMRQILESSSADNRIRSIIFGWIDYEDEKKFEADIKLINILSEK